MRVRWVPLALLVAAIIEVAAFIVVGNVIGWGWAVLAVIATSIIGAVLMRREGTRAWSRFRTVTAAGERPGPHLTRAFVGLMGAFLLMIPGFVTDVIGAALFLPPVRSLAGRGVAALASRRLPSATMGEYFGPRRVRVKVGKPSPGSGSAYGEDQVRGSKGVRDIGEQPTASREASGGEVLEGEIIDPR